MSLPILKQQQILIFCTLEIITRPASSVYISNKSNRTTVPPQHGWLQLLNTFWRMKFSSSHFQYYVLMMSVYIFLLCVYMFCLHVCFCLHQMNAWWLRRQKRLADAIELQLQSVNQHVGAESRTRPSARATVFLTAEPSLQPQHTVFKCNVPQELSEFSSLQMPRSKVRTLPMERLY